MGLRLLVAVGVAGKRQLVGGVVRQVASCMVAVVSAMTVLHGVQSHAWTFLKIEV